MNEVRIGVIGIGNMGTAHAAHIQKGLVNGLKLTAVCDVNAARLTWARENLDKDIGCFSDYKELLRSGLIDAVLVATPHPLHPVIVEDACQCGLHVLTEKPAGIDVKKVEHMNGVAKKSGVVFGIMYNQRTNPLFAELRRCFHSGKLGELIRFNWIVNNWYRTNAYYSSGSWRATWDGEGGGVLMNQCPHNLDIWQWITGMPISLRAFCHYGEFHPIAVEDATEIIAKYDNGAVGYFQTSTGEYPGTNRLEISGTRGKAVIEHGKLTLQYLQKDLSEYTRTASEYMPSPEITEKVIVQNEPESGHIGILQNFTNAILYGESLLAPGEEGINGLRIANAAYLSFWTDKEVVFPFDNDDYCSLLREKQKNAAQKNMQFQEDSQHYGEYSDRWKVKW